MGTAIDSLVAGNFFDSMTYPITNLIGAEIFFSILWISLIGLVVMKSKSWILGVLVFISTSFAVVPYILPSLESYLSIFMVGGVALLFYLVFKSKR